VSLKLFGFSKRSKMRVLCALLLLGVALFYGEIRGAFSLPLRILVPIIYIAVIGLLLTAGIAPLPARYRGQLVGGRLNFLDIARSGICMIASLAWIALGLRLVPDTPAGATLLLAPFFVILGAGVFFLGRGFFGGSS
jgi:hypothetical protein